MFRFIICIISLALLASCEPMKPRSDYHSVSNQGVLKEGQSIPIVTRKSICKRRPVVKNFKYRQINSRDKRRYLYDYVTNIQSSIVSNWKKPHSIATGVSCTVRIKQRIDGCVKNIRFTHCANPIMRKSVKDAIAMASPLPMAPHPDIYDDTIELDFKK